MTPFTPSKKQLKVDKSKTNFELNIYNNLWRLRKRLPNEILLNNKNWLNNILEFVWNKKLTDLYQISDRKFFI